MRQANPKEYVLDVTRSFAYEVHRQPKRIIHQDPKVEMRKLTKKLQGALRRLIGSMNRAL